MGMQMARDVRSANLAQADRAERRKYRTSTEKRAERELEIRESAEERAVDESGVRIRSLKLGMKRGRKTDKRAGRELEIKESAEERAVDAASMQKQINRQKLENSRNPSITLFKHHRGLLVEYQKNIEAADKRHTLQMGPLNATIGVAEKTNSPDLPNLLVMREKMLADHKDLKAGLEQAFMSASNRPHEGKWSIRPYHDTFTGTTSYGMMFEGGSGPEAEAAFNAIKAMGVNVGPPPNATPATPAAPLNPNDPLGIRQPTTPAAP